MKIRRTARLRAGALVVIAGLLLPSAALSEDSDAEASASAASKGAEAAGDESLREQPSGPNPAVMAFDVVVLRPLGLVALAVGAGAFVPAAILSAPGGREPVEHALELFVIEPGKAVFVRPLGRF